jgi:hypothetical protein
MTVPTLRLPIHNRSDQTAVRPGECVRLSLLRAKSIARPAIGPISTLRQLRKRNPVLANSRLRPQDPAHNGDIRSRCRHQSP